MDVPEDITEVSFITSSGELNVSFIYNPQSTFSFVYIENFETMLDLTIASSLESFCQVKQN